MLWSLKAAFLTLKRRVPRRLQRPPSKKVQPGGPLAPSKSKAARFEYWLQAMSPSKTKPRHAPYHICRWPLPAVGLKGPSQGSENRWARTFPPWALWFRAQNGFRARLEVSFRGRATQFWRCTRGREPVISIVTCGF